MPKTSPGPVRHLTSRRRRWRPRNGLRPDSTSNNCGAPVVNIESYHSERTTKYNNAWKSDNYRLHPPIQSFRITGGYT